MCAKLRSKVKITFWLVLTLSVIENSSATFKFSDNLRICENGTIGSPGPSAGPLFRCTDFHRYPICVELRFRCNFLTDCPIDSGMTGSAAEALGTDENSCAETFCNFEQNKTCGWNLGPFWTLSHAGSTGNLQNVPTDHTHQTTGIGHFLLADLSAISPGVEAEFGTPMIGTTPTCSLEFYVFTTTTASVGELLVKQINHSESAGGQVVTQILTTISLDGTRSRIWTKYLVSWPGNTFYAISFALKMRGGVPQGETLGSVAIDDIRFINCTEINPKNNSDWEDPFGTGCQADMFNCMETSGTTNCIRSMMVCDAVRDCPSGLDEVSCACDDYPLDFCPDGNCVIDNLTLKPMCKPSSKSTSSKEDSSAQQLGWGLGLDLTDLIIAVGCAAIVLAAMAIVIYTLLGWKRRRERRLRESSFLDMTFTFSVDTAQLDTHGG